MIKYTQPHYALIQVYPFVETKTLKTSDNTKEINDWILENLSKYGFDKHKESWIKEHCEEKDRHFMEVWNDETGELTQRFVVIKFYLAFL